MVVLEVLWTSVQQQLFSNLISIGLIGNFESNGFTYVTPFPVIVCLGVNDVLFGCNVNDTTPGFPGSTHTLFLTVSGTKIWGKYVEWGIYYKYVMGEWKV